MLKLLEDDVPIETVAEKYFYVLEELKKNESNKEIKVAILNMLNNLVSLKTADDICFYAIMPF